jgi:hypothetical protein
MSVTKSQAYNPLDKLNLAKSIEIELLGRPAVSFQALERTRGAGVYVLYYSGPFPSYAPISAASPDDAAKRPIYVGKAIPKGGRKGGLANEPSESGRALADRLRHHATSIAEASNLNIADFTVRHLVVEDIWIPLGENMLIETFKPVWNIALDGFGNKTPGRRRATQYKSPWDVVHPGRKFANSLADLPVSVEFFIQRMEDFFAGRPLAKLPKVLAQQEGDDSASEE